MNPRSSAFICGLICCALAMAAEPFVIEVVDDQTNRGVPLVELKTTDEQVFMTDSAGLVAIDSPELLGRRVFFHVKSHGYEYPKDGFGMAGKALDVKAGGTSQLKVKRLNIAHRLYRTTGAGIYRDTVMAGRKAPIKHPLLNAQVTGQDSIQSVLYKGKIHWFWGDTNRFAYPLGHFGMAGATSSLPKDGGLAPSVGIDYEYFTNAEGFSRGTVNLQGPGPKWIDALLVLDGRMYAHCLTMKSLSEPTHRHILAWNDATDHFDPVTPLPLETRLHPVGHPFTAKADGGEHIYFPAPYPTRRIPPSVKSLSTPADFECFTPLAPGSRFDKNDVRLERDKDGRVVWGWKKATDPITEEEQDGLVKRGLLKEDERHFVCHDGSGRRVRLHGSSIAWNDHRKRWIMIAVEIGGASSMLGETYYLESPTVEGPWRKCAKVLTHDRYSSYNPRHHPFLDEDGGRTIYFEGTYTYTFSRKDNPTPRYDYNNVMYKLDLDDPRLSPAR